MEHDYIGLGGSSSSSPSTSSSSSSSDESEKQKKTNSKSMKETELRLGLPGCDSSDESKPVSLSGKDSEERSGCVKRGFCDLGENWVDSSGSKADSGRNNKPNSVADSTAQSPTAIRKDDHASPPVSKAQVVGWPPIRSFRKNWMTSKEGVDDEKSGMFVKVSMDGAPYLRKVDLWTCKAYNDLSSALHKMFRGFTLGKCVVTYEDKDGDWMLVGDVPWEMFICTCRRLRIMKGSEANGLAPRAIEECKSGIR